MIHFDYFFSTGLKPPTRNLRLYADSNHLQHVVFWQNHWTPSLWLHHAGQGCPSRQPNHYRHFNPNSWNLPIHVYIYLYCYVYIYKNIYTYLNIDKCMYTLEIKDHQKNSPIDLLIPSPCLKTMVFSETQFHTKIAFGLPGYTIPETNSLPLKIYFPEKKGSSPNHNVWYRYLRHPVIPLGVLGMFLGSIPSREVFWCLACNIILDHVDIESTSWLHPAFTKTFRYLKMEVLSLNRLFWEWFFPYISRIHTAYVGFQIPPFGWYLKCLVKHGTVLVVCSFHRKGIPMSITETFVVDLTGRPHGDQHTTKKPKR